MKCKCKLVILFAFPFQTFALSSSHIDANFLPWLLMKQRGMLRQKNANFYLIEFIFINSENVALSENRAGNPMTVR